MIKISLEVREGLDLSRVSVRAESISQAVSMVKGRYPNREVRVMFPIDSEEFFTESPEKREREESIQPLHGPLTKAQ